MERRYRWNLSNVLIVVVVVSMQFQEGLGSGMRGAKARLVKELLHNYTAASTTFLRPMESENGSDIVFIKWVPLSIISFHGDEQSIYLRAFLSLAWVDSLLTWDPEEHEGVDYLVLPSSEIWRPNVVLNESVEYDFSSVYYETDSVIVFPTGCVFWESSVITSTFCKFGVEAFPFDTQTCGLTFYSPDYGQVMSARKLMAMSLGGPVLPLLATPMDEAFSLATQTYRMAFYSPDYGQVHFHPLDTDYNEHGDAFSNFFTENGIWDIDDQPMQTCQCVRSSGVFNSTVYGVRYTVRLSRRSVWFFLLTLFLPCVLLSVLSVFVFCLPVESGEKISFTITILLSLFVYQTIVSAEGPDTGSPVFAYYIVLTIIEGILSIVSTIHVISFHFNVSTIIKFDEWVMKSVRRYTVRGPPHRRRPAHDNELRPPPAIEENGDADGQLAPPEVRVSDYSESPGRTLGGLYHPRSKTTEEERIQMKRKGRVIELERGLAFIFIVLKVVLLVVFILIEVGYVIGGNSYPAESCDCVMHDEELSTWRTCLERVLDNY